MRRLSGVMLWGCCTVIPSKGKGKLQVGRLLGIGVEFLIQLLQLIFLPW